MCVCECASFARVIFSSSSFESSRNFRKRKICTPLNKTTLKMMVMMMPTNLSHRPTHTDTQAQADKHTSMHENARSKGFACNWMHITCELNNKHCHLFIKNSELGAIHTHRSDLHHLIFFPPVDSRSAHVNCAYMTVQCALLCAPFD